MDSTETERARLGRMRLLPGLAGQYAYAVPVTYPGEAERIVTFVGSVYGGPTFVITDTGYQHRVSDPERFGPKLSPAWIRRYYGVRS